MDKDTVVSVFDSNDTIVPEIKEWDQMNLDPKLLRGIFGYGFEKPSPIQSRAIHPLIDGRDLIAQAQSGTGKTATFAIGAIQSVDINDSSTQVLILSPTRELSAQTAKVVMNLGCFIPELKVKEYFGGASIEENNMFNSRNVPHIICGCPGRIYDMLRRDKISCKKIKLVIFDEADEMLSHGFKDQVYNIFQYLNNDVQVGLFSATLPESIHPIIDKITRNPVKVVVNREQLTLEGIQQFFVALEDDRQKYLTLKNLFSHINLSQCIIYCNSVKRVQDLYEAMCEDEFPVTRIHSNMDKAERTRAFNEFKSGTSRVLISSNVTARGIDIQQVSVVINFDLPKDVSTYLHRIGRSGRWGRKGVGINFITRRDIYYIKRIEEYYSTQILELPADLSFLKCV